MFPVTIHFYDTIQKVRWAEAGFKGCFEDDGSFNHYYFSEGNYSCDHNRCLRAPHGADYSGCNTGIIKIEKIVADNNPDEVLYSEIDS